MNRKPTPVVTSDLTIAALNNLAKFDERQALKKPNEAFSPPKKTSMFTPGSCTPTDPEWAEMNTTAEAIQFMFDAAKDNLRLLSEWEITFIDSAYAQYQAKIEAGFKETNAISGRQMVVLYRIVQKIAATTVKVMTHESK